MIHYIIDGNNLAGRTSFLQNLQKKDKQEVRERIAFALDRFCTGKTIKATLYFDGFQILPIKCQKVRVVYSEKRTADELIKAEIERSGSRQNITMISSDGNLVQFGKVCGCKIQASEQFSEIIFNAKPVDEEQLKIDNMDSEEFKRIFGLK